ncbi:MAG: response regulator transcription factor [Acidobacteria bacterium]|nr:response regulator transcription factor [Acidobacteriota bacterium]MBK8147746.1 response regulator transcription factor [Acidobacteriota bacterium]MBK8812034.1 response regulator transcription factor [Acidobacteriota bacterium]
MARNRQPLKSYDIQVRTNGRPQWCNVSVLIVEESRSVAPHTIHIARPADLHKRFELLMRDFVVNETDLPLVHIDALRSTKRTPTTLVDLSTRQIEILRFLARGVKSAEIAKELFISRTTVNNHIQHIFKKLDAHTRLEAVRRAEQAGLI